MTTDHMQMAEPMPVEEEAARLAELALRLPDDDPVEEDESPERVAFEQRTTALWAGDTRRALIGMAGAARRLNREVASDQAFVKVLVEEVARKNQAKVEQAKWLEAQVCEHAEELLPEGKRAGKFVDIPGICRVQYVDRKRTVRIADPEAFIAWAKAHEATDLYETREHLRGREAREEAAGVLEESGELLPGVEDVPEQRTASVKWEGTD